MLKLSNIKKDYIVGDTPVHALKGINPGSSGRVYGKREGFCLETQFAPDSINHPEFIDSVLRAGEKYDFTTIFAFDVEG